MMGCARKVFFLMAHRTKVFALKAPVLERAFATQSTVEEQTCFGGRTPSGKITLQEAILLGDIRLLE